MMRSVRKIRRKKLAMRMRVPLQVDKIGCLLHIKSNSKRDPMSSRIRSRHTHKVEMNDLTG